MVLSLEEDKKNKRKECSLRGKFICDECFFSINNCKCSKNTGICQYLRRLKRNHDNKDYCQKCYFSEKYCLCHKLNIDDFENKCEKYCVNKLVLNKEVKKSLKIVSSNEHSFIVELNKPANHLEVTLSEDGKIEVIIVD